MCRLCPWACTRGRGNATPKLLRTLKSPSTIGGYSPGWLGEAGANKGCLKLGTGGVRNGRRAPRAFVVRPGRSAPATRASAREAEQLAGLRAALAGLAARDRVASPDSKPRVLGSCLRRHWGATVSLEEQRKTTVFVATGGTTAKRCSGTTGGAIGRRATRVVATGRQLATESIGHPFSGSHLSRGGALAERRDPNGRLTDAASVWSPNRERAGVKIPRFRLTIHRIFPLA